LSGAGFFAHRPEYTGVRGDFMQQKMILQTVKHETPPSDSNTIEKVLCRGLLIAFGNAGMLAEQQARAAIARLEKP
jgi:hypothetical protein